MLIDILLRQLRGSSELKRLVFDHKKVRRWVKLAVIGIVTFIILGVLGLIALVIFLFNVLVRPALQNAPAWSQQGQETVQQGQDLLQRLQQDEAQIQELQQEVQQLQQQAEQFQQLLPN